VGRRRQITLHGPPRLNRQPSRQAARGLPS
jgi:hypothetical protein